MKTSIDLEKVRKQLPFGAQSQIAKRLNVSVALVNRVLNNKSNNPDVLNAIADYLTQFQENRKQTFEKLSSLID